MLQGVGAADKLWLGPRGGWSWPCSIPERQHIVKQRSAAKKAIGLPLLGSEMAPGPIPSL